MHSLSSMVWKVFVWDRVEPWLSIMRARVLSDLGTLQPGIRAVFWIFGIDFTSPGLIVLLGIHRWET